MLATTAPHHRGLSLYRAFQPQKASFPIATFQNSFAGSDGPGSVFGSLEWEHTLMNAPL